MAASGFRHGVRFADLTDPKHEAKGESGMRLRSISLDYTVPECDTSLIDFPTLIGHAVDSHIRLHHHSVSHHHCDIDFFNGSVLVRDLGSVHGTFVNGTRIQESTLKPGDHLAVGMLTFLVQRCADKKADRQPVPDRVERRRRQSGPLVPATT